MRASPASASPLCHEPNRDLTAPTPMAECCWNSLIVTVDLPTRSATRRSSVTMSSFDSLRDATADLVRLGDDGALSARPALWRAICQLPKRRRIVLVETRACLRNSVIDNFSPGTCWATRRISPRMASSVYSASLSNSNGTFSPVNV